MTPCNTLCAPTHFSMNKCKTSQALLQNLTGLVAKHRRLCCKTSQAWMQSIAGDVR